MKFVWKISLALVILAGCQDTRVTDVLRNLKGKAYTQEVLIPGYKIKVHYIPPAMQVLSRPDLDTNAFVTKLTLDSIKTLSDAALGMLFMMNITPEGLKENGSNQKDLIYSGVSNNAELDAKINAFQFEMKDKIWMEFDGQRSDMARFQMENNFGMAPGRDFLLVFPRLKERPNGKKATVSLVLDDILPGMARKKIIWNLPIGKYE